MSNLFVGRVHFSIVVEAENLKTANGKVDMLIDLLSRRSNDLPEVSWDNVLWDLALEEDCPNHGGSYDCTPFCEICEGNQAYNPQTINKTSHYETKEQN